MQYLAWAWSLLMFAGAYALRSTTLAPPTLSAAMIVAGIATLPLLWGKDGLLVATQLTAKPRISVALIALLLGGLAGTPYGAQAWLVA